MNKSENKIAIIGLGYVGLPLAVEFAKKYKVTGCDINSSRISELQKGYDSTLEVTYKNLLSVQDNIKYTNEVNKIKDCNVYIVTVPTPIDQAYRKTEIILNHHNAILQNKNLDLLQKNFLFLFHLARTFSF